MEQPVDDVLQPAKASYDLLATDYDRRWRHYIARSLSKVLGALTLQGNERVLDVACGTGEMERRLLARWPGLHVVGVDLSSEMLAQAKAKRIAGDIVWLEGQASNLPFQNGDFDLLLCANSFHYFRDPAAALAEFRRCLAPGGGLILVDWCDDYFFCKLCSLWLKLTDPAYFCTYTLGALQDLVTNAGFRVIQSERFKVSWLWGMMLLFCSFDNAAPEGR